MRVQLRNDYRVLNPNKMKAEEFAKKEGFFDSPYFPMNHVSGLMERYAEKQIKELTRILVIEGWTEKELNKKLQALK